MSLLPAELKNLVWMWRKGVSLKMEKHEETQASGSNIFLKLALISAGIVLVAGVLLLFNLRFNKALEQLIPDWKLPIAEQCDKVNEQFEARIIAMPVIDKQMVLSDLHLGIGDVSDDSFFDDATTSLFGSYADRHGTELILAGDILELAEPLVTKPLNPAIIEKIALAHPGFFWSLGQFLRNGGRLVYIVGNHDMPMVLPAFQKAFLEQVYGDWLHFLIDFPLSSERIEFVAGEYGSHATLVMHGQQQDPANQVTRAGVHSMAGSCWFDESEGIKVVAGIRSLEECAPWADNAKFINLNSNDSWSEKLEAIEQLFDNIESSGCMEQFESAAEGWIGRCRSIAARVQLFGGPSLKSVWDTCSTAVHRIRKLNAHGRTSDRIISYIRDEFEGLGWRVFVAGHTHRSRVENLSNGQFYFNTGTWTPHTYEVTTWERAAHDWRVLREKPAEALRPAEEWKNAFGSDLPYVQVNYVKGPLPEGMYCAGQCNKFFDSAELKFHAQTHLKTLEPKQGASASFGWWIFWVMIFALVMADIWLRVQNYWYRAAIIRFQKANEELASRHQENTIESTSRITPPFIVRAFPFLGPLLVYVLSLDVFKEVRQENDRLGDIDDDEAQRLSELADEETQE